MSADAATMPLVHVVHCIDTEGPLKEDLSATFERLFDILGIRLEPTDENLKRLQRQELDLGGLEGAAARAFAPALLSYNNNWQQIRDMLLDALGEDFRRKQLDDFGNGWTYSWHCMDHAGYSENPRRKDTGFGNVFRFYREILAETGSKSDEVNWHFHPLSFSRNPLHCATSYENSMDVLHEILARRLLDEDWFPLVNRPGFHTERPDSHLFLEQWIPFDFANQAYEIEDGQPDLVGSRWGDWRRAPATWSGYQPHHDDYQRVGGCRRWIFRCLNLGTRFKPLTSSHVDQACSDARENGVAILAFSDHDYRDIRPDVDYARSLLEEARSRHADVSFKFSGAAAAARGLLAHKGLLAPDPVRFDLELRDEILDVRVASGQIFGPQPYLALKTRSGDYLHDNFDVVVPDVHFRYHLDANTIPRSATEKLAVASAGTDGRVATAHLQLN